MEEASAAAITEDGADNSPLSGHGASKNDVGPSAEDKVNDRDGIFCCQHCGETFREEAAYVDHCQQHVPENVQLDDQLDGLHNTQKDNEKAHFCSQCSLSFVDLTEFHMHMEKNHGKHSLKDPGATRITKQRTYECLDCGKCYYMIGHFLNHQRSHRQASKSVFHDLEHLKKKQFQCESCGRNYSRASALDAHRRCHEEKLIKSRNKNLGDLLHAEEPVVEAKPPDNQIDDTPVKLYKCSCGKAFSAQMRLKTHQRFSRNSQCCPEEMKEKTKKTLEFYCSECNKCFSGQIALFNHQRWHANSEASAKKYQCEECGRVFMTATFYYRHQRQVHSEEAPAKSFLHQVCQLQKKAFECKDCGLKFSRASALHAHELHHTDVFQQTENVRMSTSLLPQQTILESERKETENLESSVESETLLSNSLTEDNTQENETDEDVESYEPGDFNVQVISASESEDESTQDPNPDLELLCESDHEGRDDITETTSCNLVSKPEMDLKIVQVDFEQADEQHALLAREAENNTTGERFDCPECYRWFSSASSLRIHRMWHGVHKKRQAQGQSATVCTSDTISLEDISYTPQLCNTEQHQSQNTIDNVLHQAEELEKKNLTCGECGKSFSHFSALVSHQLNHPKRKQFQCPDCTMCYLHAASLFNHMKNCSAQKKENISVTKKEYNPKKTLLGPKIYHCEQCGKGFWSLGAYSHHKQNQAECAELRQRKGVQGSLLSVNGHSRSRVKVACPVCGRKFRHRGIMALHMRKHENGDHKCELCHRSFRLFSSLLRHQVVHNDQLLPPPIKSFQHQVEQLKKNTYSCPDCGKLFSRAKALQFHMKSHGYETGHSPSSPRAAATLEDRQCATCFAHFNNKASLRAHQKLCIKRESQPVNCKTESSGNNDDPKFHKDSRDSHAQQSSAHLSINTEVKMEIHCGENQAGTTHLKYKCKKCERSFSVVGALNLHKRVHAEGYKSVAKEDLAPSVMLKETKQEDPSKGLFHCLECGRRFMTNSALGSHKRWHKGKKFSRPLLKDDDFKSVSCKTENGLFQCNRCGKQFFNYRVLQRHQMFNPRCQTNAESNSSKIAESSSTLEFSSPEYNKKFVQSSLLVVHCKNEQNSMLDAADHEGNGLVVVDSIPKQFDISHVHQCSLCSMTFAKARGLRAHMWQAHSKDTKNTNKVPLSPKMQLLAVSSDSRNTEDSAVDDTAVMSSSLVAKEATSSGSRENKNIGSTPQKSVTYLDSGEQCSPTDTHFEHHEVFEQEVQSLEATADVSTVLNRLSENSVKCFFKCDKCGKAFQTEEHLSTHKTRAKSRPYCCALCCHGFWSENQLQQHLSWHDEVRCRLPNEVRYRLSTALTSNPLTPNPSAYSREDAFPPSMLSNPTLMPDSQSQCSHKCQHCGKTFLSPTALQKHETQHCNDDSYHCSICPRTFSDIQDLIDHHQECISD